MAQLLFTIAIFASLPLKCTRFRMVLPRHLSEIFGYKNDTVDVSSNTRLACKFYNLVKPKTTNYVLETLRHLAPKIWNILPVEITNVTSLQVLRLKIKTWIPINCPCRICATYIPSLGFI